MKENNEGFFKRNKNKILLTGALALGLGLSNAEKAGANTATNTDDAEANKFGYTTDGEHTSASFRFNPATENKGIEFAEDKDDDKYEGGDGKKLKVPKKTTEAINSGGPLKPVLDYGEHTKEEIRDSLLVGSSPKAKEMKRLIFKNLESLFESKNYSFGEENLSWAFEHIYSREMQLKKGTYTNSGWNPKTNKIEQFPGADWEGFVWVFSWTDPETGIKLETIIAKQNCANPLDEISETTPETKKDGPGKGGKHLERSESYAFAIDWGYGDKDGNEIDLSTTKKKDRFMWFKDEAGNWHMAKSCLIIDYNDGSSKGHFIDVNNNQYKIYRAPTVAVSTVKISHTPFRGSWLPPHPKK